MKENKLEQLQKEVSRYFRLYGEFCKRPNEEIVNDLVSSAFRANERLKKATFNKRTFGLDVDFFILRALRNHFTHAGEIDSDLKGFNSKLVEKLTPELNLVCLVPKGILNVAINKSENFDLARKANSQLQNLSGYIDIHPFIFNFSVKLFEEAFRLKLDVDGDSYKDIKRAYKVEKIYEIDHFIKSGGIDISLLDSSFVDNLIPLEDFVAKKAIVDEHRDLVGMHFGGKEVTADVFDTDEIIKQLIVKTKTLDGAPISIYAELLSAFDSWAQSPTSTRLKSLLELNNSYINETIQDNLDLLARFPDEKIRNEVLKSKRLVVNHVFSLLLNNNNNELKLKYALYCALIVSYKIALNNDDEAEHLKVLLGSILFESDIKKINRIFDKAKKNKQVLAQSKFLITSQVVMMLLEFPFDDFIFDSVI
jgi:hypothetical protein